MTYKEYLKGLLKEEHFKQAVDDIKGDLLKEIGNSAPNSPEKREQLYQKLKGIEYFVTRINFITKQKS